MIDIQMYDDLFSEDEVRRLKKNVYAHFDSLPQVEVSTNDRERPKGTVSIEKDLGRATCVITKIVPSDITNSVIKYAETHGEIDWYNFLFVRYSPSFGIPVLGPHMDEHESNFSINYQLDSNIDWPLVLEDKGYSLKDNSGLIFSPSEIVHWRDPRPMYDNEYVDVILFYFSLKNNNQYSLEEKKARTKPYREKYEEKFNDQ